MSRVQRRCHENFFGLITAPAGVALPVPQVAGRKTVVRPAARFSAAGRALPDGRFREARTLPVCRVARRSLSHALERRA